MKTVAEFDQALIDINNELVGLLVAVSLPEKKYLIMNVANNLKLSYASVNSYFSGTGKNLKSALLILEELKKVLQDKNA